MPLYQLTEARFEPVQATSFAQEGLLERNDIQRLLKTDITPIGDDLLVIAEEFGEWEESARRIDLLCLDKAAQLVVVEIKRTEDGGHMDLQAVRYAAMVSSMTLEQAIGTYARYLGGPEKEEEARRTILEFLGFDTSEEAQLSGGVRIILVSANFSTELTTSVIWLNKHDLDITCVRLRPYSLNGPVLVDVSQIIPLPEATEYEVKLKAQEHESRRARTATQETIRRFWSQLIERSRPTTQLFTNRRPTTVNWISAGIGRAGFALNFVVTEERSRIECYIDFGRDQDDKNLAAFHALKAQRQSIETAFGEPLDWQELPDRRACRVCKDFTGGWRTPDSEWPMLHDELIEGMARLDRSLRQPILTLEV